MYCILYTGYEHFSAFIAFNTIPECNSNYDLMRLIVLAAG